MAKNQSPSEAVAAPATVVLSPSRPDPDVVEITSTSPGHYPGLGLTIASRAFYAPRDAARILTFAATSSVPGLATASPEDMARLRAQGLAITSAAE